jgi:branched-chain amino acid transport system permease protein
MSSAIITDIEQLAANLNWGRENIKKFLIAFGGTVAVAVAGVVLLNLPAGLIIMTVVIFGAWRLFDRTRFVLPIFLIVLLIIAPFLIGDQYWLRVIILIGIYVILSLGLNVIVGFSGVLDLGFIAFYGIGAYSAALLMVNFGWSFWAVLPVAVVGGAAAGVLRGWPTLRLSGDYLAIVTLGFGEIVRMTFANWVSLTNGPMGIRGLDAPSIFGYSLGFNIVHGGWTGLYFLMLIMVVLTVIVCHRVRRSRVGRALLAIRENETAAACMGVHLSYYKSIAYAIGGGIGGAAGALFAGFNLFVSPNSFLFFESAIVLCMVVVGGMGSIAGAIVGAVILGAFPELLRLVADFRYLIFGALMVAVAIFRPHGLVREK